MIQTGQKVSVHYVGTLENGTQFDNSYDRGAPLEFEVGVGKVIPGFDKTLMSMEVGEVREVAIPEAEAYGPRNPAAVETVPRTAFPEEMQLNEGMQVQGQGPMGPVIATVMKASDESVTLDMNHPLAGQTLNFKIELISIL
jgi:peptidylprolyl isomerase